MFSIGDQGQGQRGGNYTLALIMCRELKVLAGNVAQRMYCSKNGHESVGRVAHQELSKKLITQKNAVRNGAKSWD